MSVNLDGVGSQTFFVCIGDIFIVQADQLRTMMKDMWCKEFTTII